ncbi:tyrosine-protein phosphatase [Microbacterium aurum]
MTPSSTRVELPGVRNLRDLGGYPAAGGRVIAPRRVFRAEALAARNANESNAAWDDAHLADYSSLGLATVIDLRADVEKQAIPSAWARPTGGAYVEIPIEDGAPGTPSDLLGAVLAGTSSSFTPADLGDYYVAMLERRADELGTALRVVADSRRHPVLVHCSAGKDRTGIVVALLLETLGVERSLVVEDFQLTGVFRPNRVDHYRDRFAALGVDPERVRAMFETPPEALEQALAHLDERYGSASGYLAIRAGVDDDVQERLRDALLTEGGSP